MCVCEREREEERERERENLVPSVIRQHLKKARRQSARERVCVREREPCSQRGPPTPEVRPHPAPPAFGFSNIIYNIICI